MFDHIVPCGIPDKRVTSLAEEGVDATLQQVVDAVAARAAALWGRGDVDRRDVVWRHRPEDLSAVQPGRGTGRHPGPARPRPAGGGRPATACRCGSRAGWPPRA